MKNQFEINGDITSIKLWTKNGTIETIIDTDDLELVSKFPFSWRAKFDIRAQSYYVIQGVKGGGTDIRLHRILTDAPKGMQVDHINQNPLDNRKSNLRIVNQSQNRQNLSIFRNNKSGYRGICWHKTERKWQVSLCVEKKRHYFGLYEDLEKAKAVLIEARKKYHPYSFEAWESEAK